MGRLRRCYSYPDLSTSRLSSGRNPIFKKKPVRVLQKLEVATKRTPFSQNSVQVLRNLLNQDVSETGPVCGTKETTFVRGLWYRHTFAGVVKVSASPELKHAHDANETTCHTTTTTPDSSNHYISTPLPRPSLASQPSSTGYRADVSALSLDSYRVWFWEEALGMGVYRATATPGSVYDGFDATRSSSEQPPSSTGYQSQDVT